jgi:hypothetical protein
VTPYERLMQEAIPVRPAAPEKPAPWTPEEQAQHRADLLEALDGWEWDREQRRAERRHLRLVDTEAA